MRTLFLPLLIVGALAATAHAHDAWVEPLRDAHAVYFGHTDQRAAFPPEKVRDVAARDAAGQALSTRLSPLPEGVRIDTTGEPALITVHYDNGYWTKDPATGKSINQARTEVPGATGGSHAIKYGKTVLRWSAAIARPQGQRLEIVPLASDAPPAGGVLAVQVLWQDTPLPGARIVRMHAEKEPAIVADAQGRAQVPVISGPQMIVVNHRLELQNDPRADVESNAANLFFSGR